MLIKHAKIVNEEKIFVSDIRIKKGRIDKIQNNIAASSKDQIIEANEQFVIQGMIDD